MFTVAAHISLSHKYWRRYAETSQTVLSPLQIQDDIRQERSTLKRQ